MFAQEPAAGLRRISERGWPFSASAITVARAETAA
jgi:hypothetical protein